MNRLALFNSPLFLGFDRLEEMVDRIQKTAGDSYPPYNIEQIDERHVRISLAVAGFKMEELAVQHDGNQLTIKGAQTTESHDERRFMHRGIATRQFTRTFVLAEGVEVTDAHLDHGLLHIDVQLPEIENKVKNIKVRGMMGESGDTMTVTSTAVDTTKKSKPTKVS